MSKKFIPAIFAFFLLITAACVSKDELTGEIRQNRDKAIIKNKVLGFGARAALPMRQCWKRKSLR